MGGGGSDTSEEDVSFEETEMKKQQAVMNEKRGTMEIFYFKIGTTL